MKLVTCALGLGMLLAAAGAWGQVPQASESQRPQTGPPPQEGKPQNQFSTTTLQVEVPVLVFDKKGQPIEMLSADSFTLYDNGRPQRLLNVDSEPRPLALGIVIDGTDPDAIAQAKRSAQLLVSMVVGEGGEAAVYVSGAEPRQVLDFTTDHNAIVWALQHLERGPEAPQGQGKVTQPVNLAELALQHRSAARSHAIVVIAHQDDRMGDFAEALMERAETDPAPVFHLVPNHCETCPADTNPLDPATHGPGVGSQRAPVSISPVGTAGGVLDSPGSAPAYVDLAPALKEGAKLVRAVVARNYLNYVWSSGGMGYSPDSDAGFDQALSLLGTELRAQYRLYYHPDDLTPQPSTHNIVVKVQAESDTQQIGQMSYRRTYFGAANTISSSGH